MAERVGFISNVTPEWLDTAFSCVQSGKNEAEANEVLNDLISQVFTAKENIGKSRRVLDMLFYGPDSWMLQKAISTGKDLTNIEDRIIRSTRRLHSPSAAMFCFWAGK